MIHPEHIGSPCTRAPPLSLLQSLVFTRHPPRSNHSAQSIPCVSFTDLWVVAVSNIKQALVRDLRLREKTIRQLEAKNATLAIKTATSASAHHDGIRSRQGSAEARKPADESRTAVLPTRRACSEDEVGVKEDERLRESRPSSVDRQTAGVVDTQENCVCGVATLNPRAKSFRHSGNTTNASIASVARSARKQLTPQASEIPGRVTTISYPRCGNRATFTPMVASKITPAMGKASDSIRSLKEAGIQREDETTASPVTAQAAGKVPNDLGRLARRSKSEDKQVGLCGAQSSPLQQPSQNTTVEHSPSPQDARQLPCTPSDKALPNDHPTSSTDTMSDPQRNVGTSVGDAEDIGGEGGGGRGGSGAATQTKGRENAEPRESSDGLVDGGRIAVTPGPSRSPVPAGNGDSDCPKPSPSNREEVGGVERGGLEVDAESRVPVPPRLEEVGREAEPETPVLRSRLVDGVPVLKYGGGRGKPKPKVLWVTPDLSEIFYTQAGR